MLVLIQTIDLESSYLQSSQQLAAVLYPCNVKQLIDGSMGKFRAKLCVSLNGVQDLVFVLGPAHLQQKGALACEGSAGTTELLALFFLCRVDT